MFVKMCLVAQCQRGFQYTGITSPRSFCRLRPYCPIRSKERPLVPIPSLGRKPSAKIGFQRFVPEIDIADERSWFWKHGIELPDIFVPLWQVLADKEILKKASSKGLHDFLGFDGRVFLPTVMPDEFIDKLRTEDYFKLIKDLKADATTIPDNLYLRRRPAIPLVVPNRKARFPRERLPQS